MLCLGRPQRSRLRSKIPGPQDYIIHEHNVVIGRTFSPPVSALTGSGFLQQALEVGSQLHYMLRRSSPEHKAIPVILEARFDPGPFQSQEKGINDQLFEACREEFLLLLLIPLDTVDGVESLDLCL